jgi:chromate reductase, NAD(P)H dehydrogenase (quinone)
VVSRVLLISGSTREHSGNTAALGTIAVYPPSGVVGELFAGLAELPAFNPDASPPPVVAGLLARIEAASAVLFCVPEYAGTLPGSLKNLLDWTVAGGELYGKPVAWVNVANSGRGLGAEADLAKVLGYVGAAVVEAACVRVPVPRDAVGDDGTIGDPAIRDVLAAAVSALVAGGDD